MPATALAPAAAPTTSSPRRVAASRANGSLSRGPLTPAGKQKSAANNRKHGLAASASAFFLPTEEPADFFALRAGLHAGYQPATPHEHFLVDSLAATRWLVLRSLAFQHSRLNAEIARLSPDLPAPLRATLAFRNILRTLELGHRYEAKYQRRCDRLTDAILNSKNMNLPFEPAIH